MMDMEQKMAEEVQNAVVHRDTQRTNDPQTTVTLRMLNTEHQRLTATMDDESAERDRYISMIKALEDCVSECDGRIEDTARSLKALSSSMLALDSDRRRPQPRKKSAVDHTYRRKPVRKTAKPDDGK